VHSLLAAGVPVTRRQFPSLAAAGDTNSAPVKYTVNVSNTGAVDAEDVVLGFLEPPGRAGSHCRFALPLVRFIPDLLTCSVHFFSETTMRPNPTNRRRRQRRAAPDTLRFSARVCESWRDSSPGRSKVILTPPCVFY
jgi:hypothetical protein